MSMSVSVVVDPRVEDLGSLKRTFDQGKYTGASSKIEFDNSPIEFPSGLINIINSPIPLVAPQQTNLEIADATSAKADENKPNITETTTSPDTGTQPNSGAIPVSRFDDATREFLISQLPYGTPVPHPLPPTLAELLKETQELFQATVIPGLIHDDQVPNLGTVNVAQEG